MNTNTRDEKIRQGLDSCPVGAFCYFIKLNSLWAAKCYRNSEDRDLAFSRQSMCYDVGLAPEAKETFEIEVDYYDEEEDCEVPKLWCYITEVIDPCVNMDADDFEDKCDLFELEYEKDCWAISEEIKAKTGWYPNDTHGSNWGWNDGKLQLLDFK